MKEKNILKRIKILEKILLFILCACEVWVIVAGIKGYFGFSSVYKEVMHIGIFASFLYFLPYLVIFLLLIILMKVVRAFIGYIQKKYENQGK